METPRGPRIRVPPPAIFLVAFLVGMWLDGALYRIRIVPVADFPRPLVTLGTVLVTAGALITLWGMVTFQRHGTSVLPFRAAARLVQSGPYRYTRNPMYLGMTVAYLGGALAVNAMWPIFLLPMTLVLLFRWVIRREEQHLWERFGDEYVAYRGRVRRWL
jgi:protein-S-isoprenylcysteine O-methyltransferase Ste14